MNENGRDFKGEDTVKNREKFHDVKNIRFVDDTMIIVIDGKEYAFSLRNISSPLYRASKTEREYLRLDKYGYGIHWPLIDEDLSINGLLRTVRRQPKRKAKVGV